jgi:heat shock protein beta
MSSTQTHRVPSLTCASRHKHSSYSSSFPIYLYTTRTEEVPDEDIVEPAAETPGEATTSETAEPAETSAATPETPVETDEDEAIVEDVTSDEGKKEDKPEEPPAPKMKLVTVNEWSQLNAQPPLWTRCVQN